jgi:aldehyde:ferredoxin oxidoreductase
MAASSSSASSVSEDRILRVDMTTGETHFEPYPEAWRLLGGRSLSARALVEECDPNCDPLGPDNLLVMAPGALSGSSAPTSGRISFGAKSPLTGGIKEANAGGEAGQHLMKLGIRAILVSGQPEDDAARFGLEIDSSGARLIPADADAGRFNYDLCEDLCGRYPKTASFIVVGPAGELRLKGASIACTDRDDRIPSRHAARGGVGAVMGSKGLKFVVIDPGRAPVRRPADPKAFAAVVKRFTKGWKDAPNVFEHGTSAFVNVANMLNSLPTNNRRSGQADYAENLDGSGIVASFAERGGGMHNCMTGCIVQCTNKVHAPDGSYQTSALEFETLALLGSNCGIQTWDEVAQLDRLCDDVGLDTIETGAAIGVYMDAGRMEYGDLSGMKKLFEEMAKGSELGRIIGNGVVSVGESTGHPRVPAVKGQAIAAWEPRSLNTTGITYATSAMGADHTAGLSLDPAIPPEKQAATSQMLQMVNAANDSSGCCMFLGCCLDDLRDFYCAFFGGELSREEMGDMAWQILEDEWAFNRRAGFTAADDHLPDWMATEALGPQQAVFDVPDEIIQAVYTRIDVGDELYSFKGSG